MTEAVSSGLIMARPLAKEGARLMIVGRSHESLAVAKRESTNMGASVRILASDVRKRHEAEEAVRHAVRENDRERFPDCFHFALE